MMKEGPGENDRIVSLKKPWRNLSGRRPFQHLTSWKIAWLRRRLCSHLVQQANSQHQFSRQFQQFPRLWIRQNCVGRRVPLGIWVRMVRPLQSGQWFQLQNRSIPWTENPERWIALLAWWTPQLHFQNLSDWIRIQLQHHKWLITTSLKNSFGKSIPVPGYESDARALAPGKRLIQHFGS